MVQASALLRVSFVSLIWDVHLAHGYSLLQVGDVISGEKPLRSSHSQKHRGLSRTKTLVNAESASSEAFASPIARTLSVSNVISRRSVMIDGAEWKSYKRLGFFPLQGDGDKGRFSIVVWEDEAPKAQRWIGWATTLSKNEVYEESIAKIPPSLSSPDAVNTMMQALPIHVVASRLNARRNSNQAAPDLSSSHIVIWGSSVRAQQTAAILSALGAKRVTIVTTSSISLPMVDVIPPAVPRDDSDDDTEGDEDEDNDLLPACAAPQSFDALIDTLGVESELGVLSLLKARHGCHTYMSTLSHSQELIERRGLLFGPGAAKSYQEQLARSSSPYLLSPPPGLGPTVSAVFESGRVLKFDGGKVGDVYTSGWSLPSFWESTTWPRDTDGGGGRFGMPVIRDLLDFDADDDDDDDDEVDDVSTTTLSVLPDTILASNDENPFVRTVVGVVGLRQRILQPQEDCLLFLSAPFCRTCRYLGPSYTRLARLNKGKIVFAKADTTGLLGKELGRYLRVESVPSFVFFAKGRRVGKSLGVTKLPSPKLQAKIDKLAMGGDLDEDGDIEDADDA
jgi:thiol-disulfide isomerase/thioredoxin